MLRVILKAEGKISQERRKAAHGQPPLPPPPSRQGDAIPPPELPTSPRASQSFPCEACPPGGDASAADEPASSSEVPESGVHQRWEEAYSCARWIPAEELGEASREGRGGGRSKARSCAYCAYVLKESSFYPGSFHKLMARIIMRDVHTPLQSSTPFKFVIDLYDIAHQHNWDKFLSHVGASVVPASEVVSILTNGTVDQYFVELRVHKGQSRLSTSCHRTQQTCTSHNGVLELPKNNRSGSSDCLPSVSMWRFSVTW